MPTSVRVGPFTYRVTSDRAEMNQRCRDETADLLGHCDRRAGVISIEPNQSPDQKRDSLLHESLHGITDLIGLAADMSDAEEEQLVRRLSPAILAFLRDNPKVVAFLTEAR